MKMKTLLPSFMLFAFTFQTIALNSETQNTIIKLEQSVISVGQLITQIENQTDYLVVFKSREVDIERYITVQNTSGKMISYLEEAFKDTDITYDFFCQVADVRNLQDGFWWNFQGVFPIDIRDCSDRSPFYDHVRTNDGFSVVVGYCTCDGPALLSDTVRKRKGKWPVPFPQSYPIIS